MPHSLQFSCALVTGASSGLGEEFARQLAPRSRTLVLVARREPELVELAARLMEAHPDTEVLPCPADLADPAAREALVAGLIAAGHLPDLLVNNAGVGDYGEFATGDWARIKAMLDVNIEALTHLTHMLLPVMLLNGSGAVIQVSSLSCLLPIPDFAVYAATKAYVTSFSEALRLELKPHGIPVLAACPGPVPTGFGANARRYDGSRDMPVYEWFRTPREEVVAETLLALAEDRPRVYPGLKTALAALVIAALPLAILRLALGARPRRHSA